MSFNSARLRTPQEPRSAGWDTSGYSTGGYVPCHSKRDMFCPPEAGCMITARRWRSAPYAREGAIAVEDPVSETGLLPEEEDDAYEYQSSQESDTYEYNTPPESELESSSMSDSEGSDLQPSPSLEAYSAFVQSLAPVSVPSERLIPEHDALDTDLNDYEHIAGGLRCRWNKNSYLEGAFNGHAISAEEMRGCNTLQCFVRKPGDWTDEPEDQDFEQQGHFFLSGLSDYAPSRDVDWPRVFPPRHDCESPQADNTFYVMEEAENCAMPFHPTCLEVFKRASYLRYGIVDYQGLINWWILEAGDGFDKFPRDPAVDNSQWFHHIAGNEFVAANPCFIPNLAPIIASSALPNDPVLSWSTGVFKDTQQPSYDVFSQLPPELKGMLMNNLLSKDIANLRLASRSFRQLPQSLFRSLTLREMPWLWEAWSNMEYSIWAHSKSSELRRRANQSHDRMTNIRGALDVLETEAREAQDEAVNRAAISALQQIIAEDEEEARQKQISSRAPLRVAGKTDWYRLRCGLAKNSTNLLGLRNRCRIWKDCEEILDRIRRFRDEGRIIQDQVVDARAVAEEASARRIEANRRWHNYCAAGRPGAYNFDDWA
jgi:hypothetical protein